MSNARSPNPAGAVAGVRKCAGYCHAAPAWTLTPSSLNETGGSVRTRPLSVGLELVYQPNRRPKRNTRSSMPSRPVLRIPVTSKTPLRKVPSAFFTRFEMLLLGFEK